MRKNQNKSMSTTGGLTSNPESSTFLEGEEDTPSIIAKNQKYRKLFSRIHSSLEQTFKSIDHDDKDGKVEKIRSTINYKLKEKEKQTSFMKKFGIQPQRSFVKINEKRKQELIGVPKLIQNQRRLNNFLDDHRQAVQLEELTQLTEYYLKDLEREKTKVDYLDKFELANKHLILSPKNPNRDKMFTRPYSEYQKNRKTAEIKNDKVLSNAFKLAKRNPTFRRAKNFAQTEYIVKEDNRNLIACSELKEKQINKDRIIEKKIFLKIAKVSETLRIYYEYIEEKKFPYLCELICPKSEEEKSETRVNQAEVQRIINKIVKYKFNKVLHFEDFRELLHTISQKFAPFNAMSQILINSPTILEDKVEQFQREKQKQISQLLNSLKIPIAFKLLYEKYEDKIIARKYLSFDTLTEIMKSLLVIPRTIMMSKFIYACQWNKKRIEGFDWEEFMNIQVYLALNLNCSLDGISQYLELFDIQDLFV